jgi:hypothetical protein
VFTLVIELDCVRYWFEAAAFLDAIPAPSGGTRRPGIGIERSQTPQDSRRYSVLTGYLTNDPGILEGKFTPALVTSTDSAMAGNHLGLEQNLTLLRG